jgi:hypothetical protein
LGEDVGLIPRIRFIRSQAADIWDVGPFFACSASKKSGLDTRVYGRPFFLVAPANGKLMFAQYCFFDGAGISAADGND